MKKISIIVPVYNAEKYIRACLESIINQTLKKIEIIIINDGSTDKTLEICNKYIEIDSRIKVINKINEGVSIARNTGIEMANGQYLMFVDADDWIDNNMCEILYKKIQESDADICISNIIKEHNHISEYIGFESTKEIILKEEIKKEIILPLIEEESIDLIHTKNHFRGPCTKLYKKSIIDDNNIRFDKNLSIGEDFIFNTQFLKKASKVVMEDSFLYHYRVNEQSATRAYKNDPWKTYKKLLVALETYLKEDFKEEEYIKRLNRLKINYLLICIRNEVSEANNKTRLQKKKYIKDISKDKEIIFAINNSKNVIHGTNNNIILFLLRNKIYFPFILM